MGNTVDEFMRELDDEIDSRVQRRSLANRSQEALVS